MSGYDIVSFGETMLRLTPPGGRRLEEADTFEVHVGGTESNTLACLARLGMRVAWMSALPDNPVGRRVERELRAYGVDTSHVVWAPSSSRLGIFYAEENPPPLGTRVYYDRAGSACAQIDPSQLDLSVVDGSRMLHLTGVTPALGEGARAAFSRLLRRAHERGVSISFDVNYRSKLWSPPEAAAALEEACRLTTILFCTREDAQTLWGFEGAPQAVLWMLSERFGNGRQDRAFVLTLGPDGAAHMRAGTYEWAPALESAGRYRFGSGDAFAAGYLYALLGGHHSQQGLVDREVSPLLVGNAFASMKRCMPGDIALITPEDIAQVLGNATTRFR